MGYRGNQNKLFESKQVQEILTRLTGVDLDKVLQKRRQDTLNLPKYSVATEIDMVKEEKIAHTVASKRLKMPPIREVRSPIDIVISEDPYLISFDDDGADYVFTDISTSVDNDTRSINVREKCYRCSSGSRLGTKGSYQRSLLAQEDSEIGGGAPV